MNQGDLDEFTQLITSLCVLHNKPVSEALIELYWRALEPFAFETVKAAFEAQVSNPDTGQFMPKPADVVRYVEGSSQTRSLLAWSKVMQAIRSVGLYHSVVFDDPLIHAVIEEMGGWVNMCMTLIKDVPFRANEFEKRYAAYVLHSPPHYPKQLTGLTEGQNRMNGYLDAIKPPLLIGDPERALAVLQHGGETLLNIQSSASLLTVTPKNLSTFLEKATHDTKKLFGKNTTANGDAKTDIEKL